MHELLPCDDCAVYRFNEAGTAGVMLNVINGELIETAISAADVAGEVRAQPRRRCGRGEPSPGADVGRGEPSPGANVAGASPAPVQMWKG